MKPKENLNLKEGILFKMRSLLSKYGELINFCLRLIQVYTSMNVLIGPTSL